MIYYNRYDDYNYHKFRLKRGSNTSLNRPVTRKINKKPDFTAQITKKEKERNKQTERERERKKLPTNLPIAYKRQHKTTIKLQLIYSVPQHTKFYQAVLRFQNVHTSSRHTSIRNFIYAQNKNNGLPCASFTIATYDEYHYTHIPH